MATIRSKFNSHLPELREAMDGHTDLRTNHKLYKKLYRYYKNTGVTFTGDSDMDYNLIMNYLLEDV